MTLQRRLAYPRSFSGKHTINVLMNVGGIAIPTIAGIFSLPVLLRHLGDEGFATLALGLALIGFFGVLDLGLAKALTLHIARHIDSGELVMSAAVARTGRRLMVALGAFWAVVLLSLFPIISGVWPILSAQAAAPAVAWTLLVLCVPATLWMNSSISILEAESRFGRVNVVRIPLGIATYVGPLISAFYTEDISWIFGILLLTRLAAAALMAWQVSDRFVPGTSALSSTDLRKLLKFGSWMTVSQIVGPMLVYFDRFAIAALISAAAVTHYTVPYDVVTRLPLLSIAFISVLFPLFAQTRSVQDDRPSTDAYLTAHRTILLLIAVWVPSMVLAALLGPALLRIWVGAELAAKSGPIWQWLVVGVAVNGLAHLPFSLLQSKARTDMIACLHLLELPAYVIAVWWVLQSYGIDGAAVVWTLRVTLDAVLLHAFAWKVASHWQHLLRISLAGSFALAMSLSMLAWLRS